VGNTAHMKKRISSKQKDEVYIKEFIQKSDYPIFIAYFKASKSGL